MLSLHHLYLTAKAVIPFLLILTIRNAGVVSTYSFWISKLLEVVCVAAVGTTAFNSPSFFQDFCTRDAVALYIKVLVSCVTLAYLSGVVTVTLTEEDYNRGCRSSSTTGCGGIA